MFSDPRILIVRCKALRIDFYVISAHAPYVKSPTNFKEACEWWVQFSKAVCDTCEQGIPVLAGIDGNYTVHEDASTGVGDVRRIGEPPPQHSSVCDFLNKSKFLIFNSFKENSQHEFSRGVPSHIPPKGSIFDAICIDHFVGSHNVTCKVNSITQCCELTHVQAADDHIPISGLFQFPPACGVTAPIPRKKVRYDRASLGDPVKGKEFINILNALPVIDCNVGNTSHCHILQNNVHSALCEAFPATKIKGKSFITSETFKHICEASDFKKKRCKLFKVFKNAPLWAVFGVWANKSWRCKWSPIWVFSSFSKLHAWAKAGYAIQYLNTHINGMLKLEALAFFSESADSVVSSFNNGDSKQFFGSINSVLKVANNKSATPKCMRVIDSHTGQPSQSVVQEKHAFRRNFSSLMGASFARLNLWFKRIAALARKGIIMLPRMKSMPFPPCLIFLIVS